jgi:hypothetical protein
VAAEWTHAPRGVQLLWFPIPAYSVLPILIWVMHARVWTFILALSVCVALGVLKAKGRTVIWVLRRLKCKLRGGIVLARPVWYRRRTQHLQSFDLVPLSHVSATPETQK